MNDLDLSRKATVEKILKVLTVDNKDVRKAEWTNKEVGSLLFHLPPSRSAFVR